MAKGKPVSGLSAPTARRLGIALTVAGSWLLYEAYELRGRSRPWISRLLPGP